MSLTALDFPGASSRTCPPEERSEYGGRWQTIDTAWPPANVEDLIHHIDFAVGLIGSTTSASAPTSTEAAGIEGWGTPAKPGTSLSNSCAAATPRSDPQAVVRPTLHWHEHRGLGRLLARSKATFL